MTGEAGVDHLGTNGHNEAADQGRIDLVLDLQLVGANNGLDLEGNLGLLRLVQGRRRGHLGQGDLALLAVQLQQTLQHRVQETNPLTIGQQLEQV